MDALRATAIIIAGVLTAACAGMLEQEKASGETEAAQWEREAMAWRERRLQRLTEPYGWLSLVGLDFVGDGRWRVGADAASDIRMPAGPEHWGVLEIDGRNAHFEPGGSEVTVDGRSVERASLTAGNDGPVWVQAEDVRFQIIDRDGRLAVRTRWPRAQSRTSFAGLDYFDFDPDWRIEAHFEYHPPGTTMPVGSVLGDITQEPNLGAAVFEYGGETFRLEAVADVNDEELFFILADRTTGRETYGAGRMLYAPMPDENDRTVLDFNRAYNPPCTFTAYSTCPLPPPENRLDVRITAGERDYAGVTRYLK